MECTRESGNRELHTCRKDTLSTTRRVAGMSPLLSYTPTERDEHLWNESNPVALLFRHHCSTPVLKTKPPPSPENAATVDTLLFLRWTAQQREMMSWVFQSLSRRGPSQSRSFEWPWLGWGCGWLRWRPDPPLGLGFDALKRYSSRFVHSKISSGNCKFPPQLFF